MTKTITFANFKGGVGKTTTSVIFSYLLQKAGKKVLLIDFDPQYNATEITFKTFNIESKVKVTLYEAMEQQDLSKAIINITPTLDLLPSELDLAGFPMHLYSLTKDKVKRFIFLKFLLDEIRDNYDYIIIDVPPTISDFTNNAIFASDFTVLIMQTQEQSYTGAVKFLDYLKDLNKDIEKYLKNLKEDTEDYLRDLLVDIDIELLGVIPYLVQKRGNVDIEVIKDAQKLFGDLLFEKPIMHRERVKRFNKHGIQEKDMHDETVLNMYQEVLNEFIERVNE
ncbi:AAA family ATPase [Bacillus sp. 37MA]|uniref:ParA family protein n=1 Tax=Bacillus sp. 37MA TaxID=1132442 RepID=UPI00036921AC|nr:AAA family ATPase [Bacillus sp. 37MA]